MTIQEGFAYRLVVGISVFICVALVLVFPLRASAQYTVLHYFNGTCGDGALPRGSLTRAGSTLFGMTQTGGDGTAVTGDGVIFAINYENNDYNVVHTFHFTDGQGPWGSLTLVGSTLYGMAWDGGAEVDGIFDDGVIFSLNADDYYFNILYGFNSCLSPAYGGSPVGSLTLVGSKLYGENDIAIFSIDQNGDNYQILHEFDGPSPWGSLTLVGSTLYGMTPDEIFSIDVENNGYKALHNFKNGESPRGSLTLVGSTLYGMTLCGGAFNYGQIFSIDVTKHEFHVLHNFNGYDGEFPYGSLTVAGSKLYGMTSYGGSTFDPTLGGEANGHGVIFSMDTKGGYMVLHNFDGYNGQNPFGDLTLVGSTLYGMTQYGGSAYDPSGSLGVGVIFSLDGVAAGPNVPGEPMCVNASAGNVQAAVEFTPPASDGGSPITSYTVTSNLGNTATGAASPIIVTGLTNGTAYTFTVTAANVAGAGPPSSPSNSVKPGVVLGVPESVKATAGNGQATVSFKLPASCGDPMTSYTATSSPGGITAKGAGSPITLLNLTNGAAYTFTVTATNVIGTGSPSNPSNKVTPVGCPGIPTDVSATAGKGSAVVTFMAPTTNGSPISKYTVTSTPGNIKKTQGVKTPITVKGLQYGTYYTFTVTATNKIGTGQPSSPSNSVTPQ